LKIIVAEDDADMAKLYKDALSERGHEVFLTTNGKDCFEEYRLRNTYRGVESRPPFDVVILDFSMPVLDGFEAAKQIFRLQPLQRIIFASAYAQDTLFDRIKKSKMDVGLLQKPFTIDALVHTVEDRNLYRKLSQLDVDTKQLKEWNLEHYQLEQLLESLIRLRSSGAEMKEVGTEHSDSPAPVISKLKDLVGHKNSAFHFSIQYPGTWKKMERNTQQVTQNSNTTIFIATSPESDAGFTVSVQNLPRLGMELEEYTRTSIKSLEKSVRLFKLLEHDVSSAAVSGYPAHKVTYSGSLDTKDRDQVSVKVLQVWCILGNKVYLLSYAASPEKFEYSLPIAQRMLDSFRLDEPALPNA
jgi:CheY-like chemotaxis protein